MRMTKVIILFSFIFLYLLLSPCICAHPLVPALYVFGDSLVDSGNNNFLPTTLVKANFLPYGSDFPDGPTGRFTNGRTVADFIAEYLGLPYAPPFLSLEGPSSLTGINYASSSCGIMPETAKIFGKCLTLRKQVNLFQMTAERILPKKLQNPTQLSEHLSKSLYIFSIGSNDYISNYLDTKFYDTSQRYQPDSYAKLLIDSFSQQLERLYNLGARKIVIFEVGPVGCIPFVSKELTHTAGICNEEANQIVAYFNKRLHTMLNNLTSTLPGSIFVVGHSYSNGYDVITNPSKYGLTDGINACCKTFLNMGTSGCKPLSTPCESPSKHVFWDGFHLTEAAYSVMASGCLSDKSICSPMSIQELVKK